MYNPEFWKHCENVTVGQFCEYLQNNIPPDAIICVCGSGNIYMHLEEGGGVYSVDDSSLSDLPEYENHDAGELTGVKKSTLCRSIQK